ncbi:hypothetical protein P5673_017319 [Acropora cervicornis]|uniref:Uncharacterized protein n=1 Tax=Acropora cervicornis TaxID=6130 RepID=A0AAD9QFQ5_ACRCE|nr:hypothetical protein P5673_017319 [Acropora cervicornis]
MGHFREQLPTLLQYAQNLANTVYESIKRESLMIENERQETMVKLSGNEQCARKLQSSKPELCL